MPWRDDYDWQATHLPTVKRILASYVLTEASFEQDTREATDLIVLTMNAKRIGVRLRRPGAASSWLSQFTLRSRRDNGVETELNKIINGWCDWLFYGHVTMRSSIDPWMIIDLAAFRAAMIRRHELPLRMGEIDNRDGTHFAWFDVDSFPTNPPICVGRSISNSSFIQPRSDNDPTSDR